MFFQDINNNNDIIIKNNNNIIDNDTVGNVNNHDIDFIEKIIQEVEAFFIPKVFHDLAN